MMERVQEWFLGPQADEVSSLAFEFRAPWGTAASVAMVVLITLLVSYYYRNKLKGLPDWAQMAISALRVAALALLLFMAMNPTLVGKKIEQGDQTVILLLDDSQSMQVVSQAGPTRGKRLIETYQANIETFEKTLQKKYRVLKYRFGQGVERIEAAPNLNFLQPRSDIVGALQQAADEWQSSDIAAMVVFSDGAQEPEKSASALPESVRNIPVHTVGVDQEGPWVDLALRGLTVKKTHFDQSPLVASTEIETRGMDGAHVLVDVLEDDKVILTQRYELPQGRNTLPIQLRWTPQKKDWIEYTLRVGLEQHSLLNAPTSENEPSLKDRVVENNTQRFLQDNRPKTYRILYASGRPNWEQKFLRRAMQEDEQLKLTSLIRISAAERKFVYRGTKTSMTNPLFDRYSDDAVQWGRYDEPIFLRMGASEEELKDGFPKEAKELFGYEAVIIGDTERDFFSTAQLELLRDFVAKRGGSLLLLGGPRSFEEGGYQGTPLESMLPMVLERPGDGSYSLHSQMPLKVAPTLEGELSGVWSLMPDVDASREQWSKLPPLFGMNLFALTRAGATVWAYSQSDLADLDRQPLFAVQRYGKGRCAVLAAGETWPWHMDTDEDPSPQQRLWRQVLRSLVNEVPSPVELRLAEERHFLQETVRLNALVRDSEFNEREGLAAALTLTPPSTGVAQSLPVEESIQEMGLYSSEFTPTETGVHRLALEAKDENGEPVSSLQSAIYVESNSHEWMDPQYRPAFLKELAATTEGEFFPLESMNDIVGRIRWEPAENAKEMRISLWRLPFFFFALPILMTIEWYLRRRLGRA